MGKALYRKYRSRSLSEIVGQDHITTTLGNALKSGKFAHAYLLTGPRGTGKTSVARILAHEINSLEYSEDTHFDIIEIDAASNNGVEDVRELREKVQSAPTSAKYKVYIIDEVHMLSKPAFNALLKTLEEPPAHVVFILATTEAHKLPETIISRTQRFSFRPVPQAQVISHLKDIAKKEKIAIDDEALQLIAEHGEGSFRDSISLLDQASSLGGMVTAEMVERLLGRAPHILIDGLIAQLKTTDLAALTASLRELYDQGYEPAMIAVQLGRRLRESLGDSTSPLSTSVTIDLLRDLLAVPTSHRPAQLLELTLFGRAIPAAKVETQVIAQPKTTPLKEKEVAGEMPQEQVKAEAVAPEIEPEPEMEPLLADDPAAETSTEGVVPSDDVQMFWHEVLQAIKQTHNTLYGIARMAHPTLEEDKLTLATKFPFHQKRLSEAKNRDILTRFVTEKRGAKTTVVCILATAEEMATANSEKPAKPDVSTISNIFGSVELL